MRKYRLIVDAIIVAIGIIGMVYGLINIDTIVTTWTAIEICWYFTTSIVVILCGGLCLENEADL